jgi:hypothetical protein
MTNTPRLRKAAFGLVPFSRHAASKKKADVAEHLEVFGHVGLLVNGSPGPAGLPFS